MIQKKIGSYISIRMGIAMSCTMSLVGSLLGAMNATSTKGKPAEFVPPPFLAAWLPSFLASLVITTILAIALGFIFNMKKINDGIESKTGAKGFGLHFLQSLVSDLIYTPIISLIMAFFAAAVFSYPKIQAPVKPPFVPYALGQFGKSFPIEFVVALIVIIIIEPIIQKAAFKKYIPGFGQGVEGDDAI